VSDDGEQIPQRELGVSQEPDGELRVRLSGDWFLRHGLPPLETVRQALADQPETRRIAFATEGVTGWDSSIVTFARQVAELCPDQVEVDISGLPEGARGLYELAEAVPEREGARSDEKGPSFLEQVGLATLALRDGAVDMVAFLGEVSVAMGQLLRGRARFRRVDLGLMLQHSGADALPIVTLISLLVGLILAFVGAVQLEQFGAAVYVADLVAIAMTREMGAMMTAIVMAGRTGAAFAAQLGSMKVNQEIDALRTMGISPLEYLVLPRMLALSLMMPLLCVYADLVGIIGGAVIGIGMLDVAPTTYVQHTIEATTFTNLFGGIFKASVYGVLVALSGCLRGMQSGDSASAVGDATTAAVVTSIVLIICTSGLFAVLFYILDI